MLTAQKSPSFPSCFSFSLTLWAQTSNLIINLDHDDWILNNDDALLADLGFGMPLIHLSTWDVPLSDIDHIENETEISFFNRQDYEDFKVNPEVNVL